jgi:hypothetical protein
VTTPLTLGRFVARLADGSSWLSAFAKQRYVRTPAGERRYGVPIGSPIPIGRRNKRRRQAPDPNQRELDVERAMSDDDLDTQMNAALVRDDLDAFERFARETDRREAETARRQRRREQDQARRDEAREARDEQRAADFEAALASGTDEESAIADIYGVPVSKQRRDRAIGELRANGHTGRSFDELARSSFRDHVYAEILRAEASDDIKNSMVTNEGIRAGIDGRSLFTGPQARADRWASDELKEWWENNPRPDFAAYRETLLGGS